MPARRCNAPLEATFRPSGLSKARLRKIDLERTLFKRLSLWMPSAALNPS
jgi:hypothetical protein